MQDRMIVDRRDVAMSDERDSMFGIKQTLGRRTALRGAMVGASGLAAAALIGCGGDDNEPSSAATSTSGGGASTANLKTTDPRPSTLPAGWDWDAEAPF